MRRESWREMAARIVTAFGGFVVSSPMRLKIGEILRAGEVLTGGCTEERTEQPFVVVGEATWEQWVRQYDFVGGVSAWLGRYHYFVQTD